VLQRGIAGMKAIDESPAEHGGVATNRLWKRSAPARHAREVPQPDLYKTTVEVSAGRSTNAHGSVELAQGGRAKQVSAAGP